MFMFFCFSTLRQTHVHCVGMSCQQMMPTMKNIGNKRFDFLTVINFVAIDSETITFLVELLKTIDTWKCDLILTCVLRSWLLHCVLCCFRPELSNVSLRLIVCMSPCSA